METVSSLKNIGLAALLTLFAACGDESGSAPAVSTPSLAGNDANNDGVRDDIEAYIDATYPVSSDAETNRALRQYARAAQASTLDTDDSGRSVAHVGERFRALECLMARQPLDFHPIFVELRARILDTNPRSEAYLRADSHAAAADLTLLPASQWAGACL